MNNERAPATANVEQSLARAQPQFTTDVIELLFLRGTEITVRRLEIRARVNHAPIQPEPVKIIRNVIMKCDHATIAFQRMLFVANSRQQLSRSALDCRS